MGKASRKRRDRRLGGIAAPQRPVSPVFVAYPQAPRASMGKISGALMDMVEPLMDVQFTLDQARRTVQLAALVWNLSLLDEEKRRTETDRLVHELAPEDSDGMRGWIDELIERKRRLHPEDGRFIVSTEVVRKGDGFSIFAVGAAAAG